MAILWIFGLFLKLWIGTAAAVSPSIAPIEPSLGKPSEVIAEGNDGSAQALLMPVVPLCLLDKITGRVFTIKVNLHQMVIFDTLRIIPRICYRRVNAKASEAVAFLEIWDMKLENSPQLLFSNWMFSLHPEMSALEHPVYDVWVQEYPLVVQEHPHLQSGNRAVEVRE